MEDVAVRVVRAKYRWDEDQATLLLLVEVPGQEDGTVPRVAYTGEGGLEFDCGMYHIKGQLARRVTELSVGPLHDGRVLLAFRKHALEEWGRVWLAELDEDDDVDIHLRRERGLALRPKHPVSSNSVKESLLKRFRVGRVFSIPLGYTKQVLHDMWGLDLIIWGLAILLAYLCPPYSIQGVRSSSSFAVVLLVRSLSWPLVWGFRLPAAFAMRIIVASMVVTALKLYRLEIGSDQPVSWARAFAVACGLQYAFLSSFSWSESSHVFALVGVLLMYKFWHAERYTRMAFIGIFSSMLLHFDVILLLFVIVVDCVIRRRLRLAWLLWCVVVFSIMTWIFFVLPFDSFMHERFIVMPSTWRDVSMPLDWITWEELIPLLGLACIGVFLQPQLRRYLFVGVAFQGLMWLKGDSALLSLWLAPLMILGSARAIETLWQRRRRWMIVAAVLFFVSLSLAASTHRFLSDKCTM